MSFHGAPLEAPIVLPFTVVSYNGEDDIDDEYPISNVLHPSRERFHCSKSGSNFDLILQYTPESFDQSVQSVNQLPECLLTHVVIRGPPSCSAPVRTGMVFAHSRQDLLTAINQSNSQQSLKELVEARVAGYTHRYDSLSRAQYESQPLEQMTRDGVVTYFTISNRDSLEVAINLPTWTKACFVHIKLIASDPNPIDDNIDIERVALVGFENFPSEFTQVPLDLPSTLQLTRRELTAGLNPVHPDFMSTMINQPCCLLIATDPMKVESTMARSIVASFAESSQYNNDLNFFYFDRSMNESVDGTESPLEELVVNIADHLGIIPTGSKDLPEQPKLVIALIAKGLKFIYNGQWEAEELRTWFDAFFEGTLEPFRKSLPRPEGDRDPEHEGITVLVGDSFDEIVLEDTIKDCIVHLSEAWSGTLLTLSIIWHIAGLLKQHYPRLLDQSLTIGTMDIQNDVRADLFDDSELPIIKFFPATSKTDPETFITYNGPALCSSILSFIHRHLTCRNNDKFDLQRLITLCAPIDAELEERSVKLQKFAELTRILSDFEFQLTEEQNDIAYRVAIRLKPLVDGAKDFGTLGATRHEFAALIGEFEECLRPLQELSDVVRLAKASTSLAAELVFMTGNALTMQERHNVDFKTRMLLSLIPNRNETDSASLFYPIDDSCLPPDEPLTAEEIAEIRRQSSALFALQDSFRPRVEAWRKTQPPQQ